MPAKKKKAVTSSIKNEILIAEGLRCDGKYFEAKQRFEEIEAGNEFKSLGSTHPQVKWVLAHHAEALSQYFVPYMEREDFLDCAERRLREVLDVEKQGKVDKLENLWAEWNRDASTLNNHTFYPYAWAWARLGEVLRKKGNLPVLGFKCKDLHIFSADKNYKLSEICFVVALKLRPDYSWADAHYGAMLTNARRNALFKTDDIATKALTRLTSALKARNFDYPWAQIEIGVARFVRALRTVSAMEVTKTHQDFILVPFYVLNALLDDPPALLTHLVQPGAIALDRQTALAYDLLDFLPKQWSERVPPTSASSYLDCVDQVLELGRSIVAQDPIFPASGPIRHVYASLLIKYLQLRVANAGEAPVIQKAQELLDNFPTPDNSAAVGPGYRLRLFDGMMAILKTCVILRLIRATRAARSDDWEKDYKKYMKDAIQLLKNLDGIFKVLQGGDPETVIGIIVAALREDFPNHFWILSPIWVLASTDNEGRRDLLKKILTFKNEPVIVAQE